jgi:hypothetical protein
MKRIALKICALLMVSFSTLFVSCTKEVQTPGMLTIRVISSQYGAVAWENVHLATSVANLQAHAYLQTAMTSDSGYVKFDSLAPGMYWYGTEHWDDYGAVDVYYNIDTHVVLWVNTPAGPGK